MKLALPCLCLAFALAAFAQQPPLDVPRAKALMERFKAGETLNPDDAAYLERVKQVIRERQGGGKQALRRRR